jgi:UDP-N-acetylglucosamine transferase subunit ALG13
MIFVTVGTYETPFDRLLRAVEPLTAKDELVIQTGPSTVRPAGATCIDYLSFDRLVEHIRGSSAVISHAGVGSIMTTVANGRRPVVVPRLRRYDEVVDDHQLELARRLDQDELVVLVEDPAELGSVLEETMLRHPASSYGNNPIAHDLREYLDAQLARL